MKTSPPFDNEELLTEAKASEHQEAYHTLERNINYRIGVGVRITAPNPPHFFVEILIYLAADNDQVDIPRLKKSVFALEQLQSRHFSMGFQDGNCISCEKQVLPERLKTEYQLDQSLMKKVFGS